MGSVRSSVPRKNHKLMFLFLTIPFLIATVPSDSTLLTPSRHTMVIASYRCDEPTITAMARRRDRTRKRRCVALLVIALSSLPESAESFAGYWTRVSIPNPHTTHGWSARSGRSLCALWAANKRKNNAKTLKMQSKTSNASSKPTKQTPTTAAYQPPKKSVATKSAPPWQVLSTKEAKKNVEKEKTRRTNIKEGMPVNVEENEAGSNTLSKAFLSEAESRFLNWRRFNPVTTPAGQRFVGAYLDKKLPPRLGVPEVAFLGRSNVGKSSLLNRLSTASGDQARVGKTPGATASVNLYALLDSKQREILGFTDLPGFGYAKLSKDVQESVMQAAEHYLSQRSELALGILLVDIRREPSDNDRAVLAALFDMGVPIVVVATKIDKISSVFEREQLLQAIQNGLGLPEGQPLCVSSVTGEGCRDLWRIILEACESCVAEFKSKFVEDSSIAKEVEEEKDPWFEFEDGDDVVYDQGYDWIHDSDGAVVYDYENDFNEGVDGEFEDAESDVEAVIAPQRETLKSLKKKVRDMERRGEI